MSNGGEEHDLRAAEYVLGTLPADERIALERARPTDSALDASVRSWEHRLAPLALTASADVPDPALWNRIDAALSSALGVSANDNRLEAALSGARRWRLATAACALLALGTAGYAVLGLRPAATRYLAVVNSGGDLPALIVTVDTRAGTAELRPVAAKAPAEHSLQLWYVGADASPKPIGLIGAGPSHVSLPADARGGAGMFAVSVEPPGGSPTGLPTGKVVYTGKLIKE